MREIIRPREYYCSSAWIGLGSFFFCFLRTFPNLLLQLLWEPMKIMEDRMIQKVKSARKTMSVYFLFSKSKSKYNCRWYTVSKKFVGEYLVDSVDSRNCLGRILPSYIIACKTCLKRTKKCKYPSGNLSLYSLALVEHARVKLSQ